MTQHGEDDGYFDLIEKIRDTNKLLNETFVIKQENWDNFIENLDDLVDYTCVKKSIKSNDIYMVSRMYALMNSTYLTTILDVTSGQNGKGSELEIPRLPLTYIKMIYNNSSLGYPNRYKKALPPHKESE